MTASASPGEGAPVPRNPVVGLAAGTIVLGASNYVYLALVGNVVGGVESAPVSVLWTMMAGLAVGLFQPVEQVLSRALARRRARGLDVRPSLRRVALLACSLLLASLVVLAVAFEPASRLLFSGRSAFTLLLAAGLVSSTVLFFVRGWLAGQGRFGSYAVEMAFEGLLKIGAVAVLAGVGLRDPMFLAVPLVVAPLAASAVAVLVTGAGRRSGARAPVQNALTPGGVADAAAADAAATAPHEGVGLRSFAALTTGSLLLQLFVNAGVLLTQLSVGGQATAFTASLVAGLAIARIPLFLFNAVQSFLLTRFSVDAQAGRFRSLARSVGVWNAVVVLLGVAWVVLVNITGATALSLFGPGYELATLQLVLLAASCVFQIATMVTVQGLLALHRDRTSIVAWPVGLVVLLAVFALPWSDLGIAIGAAMLAGTATAFVTAVAGLVWSIRRNAAPRASADLTTGADPVH
ncbi:hypothetical protein [Frigoribacterium sp. R86507]|uniref:hypothetical protein n=1 Tax=Frigoribacterium sp. R86507 TaxID=3093850 RepID=UPI0037C9FB84